MDQQTSQRSQRRAEMASGGAGTSGPGAKVQTDIDIVVMNAFLKLSTILSLAILFMSYLKMD